MIQPTSTSILEFWHHFCFHYSLSFPLSLLMDSNDIHTLDRISSLLIQLKYIVYPLILTMMNQYNELTNLTLKFKTEFHEMLHNNPSSPFLQEGDVDMNSRDYREQQKDRVRIKKILLLKSLFLQFVTQFYDYLQVYSFYYRDEWVQFEVIECSYQELLSVLNIVHQQEQKDIQYKDINSILYQHHSSETSSNLLYFNLFEDALRRFMSVLTHYSFIYNSVLIIRMVD